jgi:Lon-like ATP-dependent protease
MCTANVVEDIPAPLRDRMEVIRLVGYIADEKMHIARDYLEPTAQKNSGVRPTEVSGVLYYFVRIVQSFSNASVTVVEWRSLVRWSA